MAELRPRTSVLVWAAVVLWAVAAGSALAHLDVYWDGQFVSVPADEAYADAHPDQVGVQAVVADTRDRLDAHLRQSNPASQPANTQAAIPPEGNNKMTTGILITIAVCAVIGLLIWIGVATSHRSRDTVFANIGQTLAIGGSRRVRGGWSGDAGWFAVDGPGVPPRQDGGVPQGRQAAPAAAPAAAPVAVAQAGPVAGAAPAQAAAPAAAAGVNP